MAADASGAPGTVVPAPAVPAPAVAGVVGMLAAWDCGFTGVAGGTPRFVPAPPFAAIAGGPAPTGARVPAAPAAVAGLPGGGGAAVVPPLPPVVVAPPAVSGVGAGAALAAAEGVAPAVAGAMPIVGVAVPEPGVIAAVAVVVAVAEDRLVIPVAMVAGPPAADRSLEADEPATADCTGAATAAAGPADVTGPAIEFAMTCSAARFTGDGWFAVSLPAGAAVMEVAGASYALSKPPLAGQTSSANLATRAGAWAAEPPNWADADAA